MATRTYLGEGSNINRPPSFNGEHFNFWKIRMRIFIESQDLEIWDAIENGPFIPSHLINNVVEVKPKSAWNDDDRKRIQYDLKAKNILTSALGMDEFFRISNCSSSKEMWDTLVTTHEGTDEVKRSRLNTLSQEYEMFRMLPNEKIHDLQKRFTHLTNHLSALGKDLSLSDLNLKVLRSLTRAWQPKVTAISEKKSLSKMTLATLFGKLQEHELELGRLEQSEENERQHKTIALKTKEVDQNDHKDDDDDMTLLVKRFSKFLKNKNFKNNKFSKKNENTNSSQNITCFECGKVGHMKADCPNKKKEHGFKNRNPKKAYIVWDDNEVSTSSESENEEDAHIALMASHESDDEFDEVCETFESSSYNELQNAFNELHEELVKLSKVSSSQKKIILSLESEIKSLKENASCNKCNSNELKIKELNEIITTCKGSKNLDNMLKVQKPLNDRRGLGFSSQNKSSKTPTKTTFVKPQIYVPPNKRVSPKKINTNKIKSNKSSYHNHKNSLRKPTCFYCDMYGHTPNTCYIRKVGIPSGAYIWVEKGTNMKGPKSHWVPNSSS